MARPKPALPSAEAIRSLVDTDGRLAVRVTPGARGEALEVSGGKLIAKVRAKPEGGKANDAVISLVANAVGLAPSRITLLRGATSREKLFRLEP